MNPADRLIVALDVPVDSARSLVIQLKGVANNFKLGVGAFLSPGGFAVSRFIVDRGHTLMIDLKLYDTRDTVKRTMEIVAKLGATMATVHADCAEHAVGFGPQVLAVTELTDSANDQGEYMMGMFDGTMGIVCPPRMAKTYRREYGKTKLLVCPGIRPAGAESDNHLRPATPREAIEAGADYIVVGRPIYAAPDPVTAARAIIDDIEEAMEPQS